MNHFIFIRIVVFVSSIIFSNCTEEKKNEKTQVQENITLAANGNKTQVTQTYQTV